MECKRFATCAVIAHATAASPTRTPGIHVRRLTGNLQRHRLLAGIHDVSARLVHDAEKIRAIMSGDGHLDERKIPGHGRHDAGPEKDHRQPDRAGEGGATQKFRHVSAEL